MVLGGEESACMPPLQPNPEHRESACQAPCGVICAGFPFFRRLPEFIRFGSKSTVAYSFGTGYTIAEKRRWRANCERKAQNGGTEHFGAEMVTPDLMVARSK